VSDSETVYRATVRGRFADLTERARQFLVRSRDDHDIFRSAYTPEGTFTFDAGVAFFNLRYELRSTGPDGQALVELEALEEAEHFLSTMGFGHTPLTVSVVDMSAMVSDAERRR
jgi:Family of unknown function (DUF6204)